MQTSAKIAIDYAPRRWQLQCHKNRKRFSVFALHRRAGKTELAIMELLNQALKFDKPLGIFCYVAPYRNQAESIIWARLLKKVEPLVAAGLVQVSRASLSITVVHNGAVIMLLGGDNYNAIRGLRLDGIVIDEVAQIKPELWDQVVQPALSDRKGWAIFIGTPDGINMFSSLFYAAAEKKDWYAARYTIYDTEALPVDEVERLRRDMSPQAFAREYLCDFTAAGDDQLISLADVEDAAKRVYTEGDIAHAPTILGVDPARFGDDRSVIIKRRGLQAYDPWIYQGIDNMELAARVSVLIGQHKPDAVFIDSGAGAGVIDRLRQIGHDVIEVPFGGKASMDKQYINRRGEMWWAVKEWIGQGGAIPDMRELKQELATPTYWYDSAGRKVLESKDDIKRRLQGGASPDIADALALTFAFPVAPMKMRYHKTHSARVDYDPYEVMR